MCWRTRLEYTRSNDPSAKILSLRLSLCTKRQRRLSACRARACASMEGEISAPVTARKCAESGTVSRPAPQPKSSASSRPAHSPSRSRVAIAPVISAFPLARNSWTSQRPPRLAGSTQTAHSGSASPSLVQSRRSPARLRLALITGVYVLNCAESYTLGAGSRRRDGATVPGIEWPPVAAWLLARSHVRRADPAGHGHHRAVARSQPDPDDCGPALSCLRQIGPAAIVGLLLGMLALGPGLKRGFLLSYDMVSVPRQPFTATIFGLTGTLPRAVPSDAVAAAAARALPADIVQKLLLLSIFVLACSGMAALLAGEHWLARLAGAVFYAWNPFVAERLIIGQWALLLGYGALPWVLCTLVRTAPTRWRPAGRLTLALLPAAVGGFSAMCLSALVVVPAAACAAGQAARRILSVGAALLVLAVLSLPWLVPALTRTVHTSPAGVAAFAARADTPFGAFGSLLMLSGVWNAQTVPAGYGGPPSAGGGGAGSGNRRRSGSCGGVHRTDRPRPRPAPGDDPVLAGLRGAQGWPAVRRAAGPGRGGWGRARRGVADAAPPDGWPQRDEISPGCHRGDGTGRAAAWAGLGSRRAPSGGAVSRRLAGSAQRHRRRPGAGQRAAAAVGGLPPVRVERQRGGA